MSTFRRQVYFEPGYSKRAEGKGVHGMQIRFVLVGPHGATQFMFGAGWVPGEAMPARLADAYPSGYDLGHHWLTPTYEGEMSYGACSVLNGRDCFYDGSGLRADAVLKDFIADGERAVWHHLIEEYRHCLRSARAEAPT